MKTQILAADRAISDRLCAEIVKNKSIVQLVQMLQQAKRIVKHNITDAKNVDKNCKGI